MMPPVYSPIEPSSLVDLKTLFNGLLGSRKAPDRDVKPLSVVACCAGDPLTAIVFE